MNAYIVNEISTESKITLRSWICMTIEAARECLNKRYEIAKTFNMVGGKAAPVDCREHDFFFWDEQKLKYQIEKAEVYA